MYSVVVRRSYNLQSDPHAPIFQVPTWHHTQLLHSYIIDYILYAALYIPMTILTITLYLINLFTFFTQASNSPSPLATFRSVFLTVVLMPCCDCRPRGQARLRWTGLEEGSAFSPHWDEKYLGVTRTQACSYVCAFAFSILGSLSLVFFVCLFVYSADAKIPQHSWGHRGSSTSHISHFPCNRYLGPYPWGCLRNVVFRFSSVFLRGLLICCRLSFI